MSTTEDQDPTSGRRVPRKSAVTGDGVREASSIFGPPGQETRGRPADAPPGLTREELAEKTNDANFLNNPDLLTRRSLSDEALDGFIIPAHLKKPGWDYEFKARTCVGQPISSHMIAIERNQGWRPAPARDFLEILPPEYTGNTVEFGGQILMMRPMRLSREARNEMIDKADRQRQEKLKQAIAGPSDQDHRMPRVLLDDKFKSRIEGEVGTWRPNPEGQG